jgi:organic radical activating enzyme
MEDNQNVYGVWVPTYRCPRRCPWCLTRHRDRSFPFIGAEVFLRAAEPFGQVTACISGGEPLTGEAYALATAEVSHHYPSRVLTGLSLPITDSTFRTFVLRAKPENVRVCASLHTMSPGKRTLTFDDIERQKYFDRVQELVNRGFAVEINILYTHKNKNYVVLKAAERLAQTGVFMDALPYQRYDRISVKRRRMKNRTGSANR